MKSLSCIQPGQGSTDVFALAEKKLDWIAQRQGVLAQNVANLNTPGYVAQDITPFSAVLAEQALRGTSGGAKSTSSAVKTSPDRAAVARSLDGNGVTVDDQLEKIAETDTAHQLAMNLYKSYLGMFRTAIGRS